MSQQTVKTHYSAAELAAMRLPMLPTSKGKVLARAEREAWPNIEVTGVGGKRREYAPPASIMAAIKEHVVKTMIVSSASEMAQPVPIPSIGVKRECNIGQLAQVNGLTDRQKQIAEARAALLLEVERIAQVIGREKAITKVVIMAQDGTLPEHLARLVPVANARAGCDGKRTLTRRTLYRWFTSYKPGDVAAVNALAPKDQNAPIKIPAWASDLLPYFQVGQNVSLAWAVEQIADKHGIDKDRLYHRARRFLDKMGNVERQVGRMGSRAIKNLKPFVRRDSSMLWPGEVYTADGHTFDAEIAHPAHGKPFRPEVTGVIDVGTRRMTGWSIDLAESGLAVLDALRRACEVGGIPSIFYVDNGSGYKNALMSQPGVGMESRLRFTMTHSIPYNSQARGIIERSHQTIWVRAAKELPTYIGASMDAQAKQKVHKLTRRDVALAGNSRYLMSFQEFVTFCEEKIDAYNNRPHRGLPMVFDPALGRKRHMSPNEAWAKGVAEGADLVTITPEESRELFRPQREAKVLRGEVRLFNNTYFSHELTEYHGEIVRVAYDIHNGEEVWVYDQKGRFICAAGFEANKRQYFPESFREHAARKRAEGRLNRIEAKRDEVCQELQGAPLKDVYAMPETLESNGVPALQLLGGMESEAEVVDVHPSTEQATENNRARPIFELESDRYEWLMQNRDAWNDNDRQFLAQFVASDIYDALRERFEALGLGWKGSDEEVFKVAV